MGVTMLDSRDNWTVVKIRTPSGDSRERMQHFVAVMAWCWTHVGGDLD
jgi:hypothetical protein